MVGTKNNRRAQATEEQLKQALLQLLAHQPLAKITVTALCREADVNRGTFYTHFADPQALFQAIEMDLIDQVAVLVDAPREDMAAWLTPILRLLKENAAATEIIIRNLTVSPLLLAIMNPLREASLQQYERVYHETDPQMLTYYFTFHLSGAIQVITSWLKGGAPQPPQAIAKVIAQASLAAEPFA
ncbi:TetR/AcrR family transcriptional regulator [Lacticaseibacillus jixianensis]|uniref:TetR/AcrR family transcriptional regulator n=1 Tax=Lacticaseibacillus jixianensis TaxID=2486012 RepID=A0ABW4B820_9LACO|nr:TetR/AcrR family transcriptional regulator [Lacticaseibacillus jixianensis]